MTKRSEIEALRFRLRKTELYNKILILRLRMLGVRDIIELNFDERYNPNHDPKNGQFTEGDGGGYVSPDKNAGSDHEFTHKPIKHGEKKYKKVVSEINDWY